MENADKLSSPALPPFQFLRTLEDIEAKIRYYNDRNKLIFSLPSYNPEDETPEEVSENTDRLRELYELYFSVKRRADSQTVYCTEMKRRVVLKPDKRKSEDMGSILFITINPDPSKLTDKKGILSFVSECRSFFRSYIFDVAEFVFEQRGKQEGDYPGVHCHGIARRCETPSKIRKEIKRRFIDSGICGNELHVQVKTVQRDELNVTRNYLVGVKQGKNLQEGKDKQEKQANDALFRRDFELDPVYTTGEGKLLVP